MRDRCVCCRRFLRAPRRVSQPRDRCTSTFSTDRRALKIGCAGIDVESLYFSIFFFPHALPRMSLANKNSARRCTAKSASCRRGRELVFRRYLRQNRSARPQESGFKSNFELSASANTGSRGRLAIRELRPSNGRGFRTFFRKEKLRRYVKVARRARRFPMTRFVPLRQAAKCDNTMKLLRVNKDQYTKQRGHRKIFTGRKGVSLLFFLFPVPALLRTLPLHELP